MKNNNAYITSSSCDIIFTESGPNFGTDYGKIMVILSYLSGLKICGAEFRSLLAKTLKDILTSIE